VFWSLCQTSHAMQNATLTFVVKFDKNIADWICLPLFLPNIIDCGKLKRIKTQSPHQDNNVTAYTKITLSNLHKIYTQVAWWIWLQQMELEMTKTVMMHDWRRRPCCYQTRVFFKEFVEQQLKNTSNLSCCMFAFLFLHPLVLLHGATLMFCECTMWLDCLSIHVVDGLQPM